MICAGPGPHGRCRWPLTPNSTGTNSPTRKLLRQSRATKSAPADSFANTRTGGSFRTPLQAELRVPVRQNTGVRHGELENLQWTNFLHFVGELIGKRGGIGFAVHRNLPCRLVVGVNP